MSFIRIASYVMLERIDKMTTQSPMPQVPIRRDWQAVKSRLLSSPMLLSTTISLMLLGFVLMLGAILVSVNSVVWGPWQTEGIEGPVGDGTGGHLLLGVVFGILGIVCVVVAVAIAYASGRQPRYYDMGMQPQNPVAPAPQQAPAQTSTQ